ncbi:MAG: 16S rRNA (cytidine(1402)-2'-O)-methyltransferase [Oceanococcaceae bacterium]
MRWPGRAGATSRRPPQEIPLTTQLFVVGTPIGNLGDMSPRAVETLRSVDVILAEDTRHSGQLCRHFGIRTPLRAWHMHNENQTLDSILEEFAAGRRVALISDAGMPLISDPGFPLVRACQARGIGVAVVPGPTALTSALAISGLPAERFRFEGFLPARSGARQSALADLTDSPVTCVFYEAPHRLAAMLADAVASFGPERPAVLARELTKRYESVLHGSLQELAQWAASDGPDRRGEFVVLIGPAPSTETDAPTIPAELRALARRFHGHLPPRTLAKLLARHFQRKTGEVYALLESLGADAAPAVDSDTDPA